MMSKRYLKGGLMSRRSLILGLSMRAAKRSAVGFQKSPINSKMLYKQFKSREVDTQKKEQVMMLAQMAGIINLLLMNNTRKQYYNTPLNISQTIDLPSNLLRARQSYKLTRQPATAPQTNVNLPLQSSVKEHIEPIAPKKSEKVMMIEEKNKAKHNVLYKRLSDIKGQNQELEKYSYSKLLSKMVVVDPREQYKSVDLENDRLRAASQYSCLRGKLMNMDCQEQSQRPQSRDRFGSRCSDYSSRTTRIFKRYYMPSSEKNAPFFHQPALEQKYIYINGKKTECKRIHNFYTSQNFRNSYDRAFGKAKDSFIQRKERYLGDF